MTNNNIETYNATINFTAMDKGDNVNNNDQQRQQTIMPTTNEDNGQQPTTITKTSNLQ